MMTNFSSPATPHLFPQQLQHHHSIQPPAASPILPSTMSDGSSPVLIHPHVQMATPMHAPQNPPAGPISSVNPSPQSQFSPYWNDQVPRLPSQPSQPAYQIFMAQPQAPIPRPRKPYTATKVREMWSAAEHDRMLEGLRLYKRDWAKVTQYVGTRSAAQVRSHAQKYFDKVARDKSDEFVPRPRPKRKSATPYPRKPREDRQSVAVPVPVPIPITPSPVAVPFHVPHVLPLPTGTHSPVIQHGSQPSTPYLPQSLSRQIYRVSNPSPVSFVPPSHFSSPSLVPSPLHPPPHGTISPVTPFQHPSAQQSPHYMTYVTGPSHVQGPQASNVTPLSNTAAPQNTLVDPYSMPLHSHPNGVVDNCSKCLALQRYGNVLQELCATSQPFDSGCPVQDSTTCEANVSTARPPSMNDEQNVTGSPSSAVSDDSNGKTKNGLSTPTIPKITASSLNHSSSHILDEINEYSIDPSRIISKQNHLLGKDNKPVKRLEGEAKGRPESEDEGEGVLVNVKTALRKDSSARGKRSKRSLDDAKARSGSLYTTEQFNQYQRQTLQSAEKEHVNSPKKRKKIAHVGSKESEKSGDEVSVEGDVNVTESKDTSRVKGYSRSEQQEIYDAVHSLQILAKRQSPSRSSSSITDRNRTK